MTHKERCQYGLSYEDEFNLKEVLGDLRDRMDFMEREQEAQKGRMDFMEEEQEAQKKTNELYDYGLSILGSQLGPLTNLVVKQEKRLEKNEVALEKVVATTGKLLDTNGQSESRIDNILLELEKQAEFGRKHEQRLPKLEAGALDSGNGGSAPTGSRIQPEKRPCPFCGKILSVKYLKRGKHVKKHCKKAAEAAMQDEAAAQLANESVDAPESDLVISDVHSVAELLCIEEMPVVL